MMNLLNRLTALAAIAAGAALAAFGAEGEIHNFANYNIRYANPNNGDTGDKHWSQRGSYVVKVMTDYDFDIVGMQEVTGANGGSCLNPETGRSQLEDLKAWMPDYSFLEWERSGNNNAKDYSYNVIAYKTDRYECLQSGCFWISPSPDTPGPGWDPNPEYNGIWRTCGWAKMKVRSSGEIFFFAVTHCNYGASLDGINGSEVVSKRLGLIAGDMPVVLVGDFNMRRADHPEAYRGYASYFYDAALTAKENYCLPQSNPSTTVTGQNWYPVTSSLMSGSEFDFCFYRNMEVKSRHIITEFYGRSVNPSDHFPLLMRCTLSGEKAPATVYVDRDAEAGGDGTLAKPFGTIAEGIAAAGILGTVKITAGNYGERIDIPFSVTLDGGYSHDFTAVEGLTSLSGEGRTESLVSVPSAHSLTLSNFEVKDYTSSKLNTDGAIRFNGMNLCLSNVTVCGNTAFSSGAGLNVTSARNVTLDNCRFFSNSSSENGGAAAIRINGDLLVSDCHFYSNDAKNGPALSVSDAESLLIRCSAFSGNTSRATGALYLNGCPSAKKYTIVNSTFASNTLSAPSGLPVVTRKFGGAAIATDFSADTHLNIAHITVTGNKAVFAGSNKANFGGAAVNSFGLGTVTLLNNIIAGNHSDVPCADVAFAETATVDKSRFNIFTTSSTVAHKADATDFCAADPAAAVKDLAALLDGEIDADGRFVPDIRTWGEGITPIVRPIGRQYAGKAVDVLTNYQRLLEQQFNHDIDGNGTVGGVLTIDQCRNKREDSSMPGAAEYIAYAGVSTPAMAADSHTPVCIARNVYRIDGLSAPVAVYSAAGALIEMIRPDSDGAATVDATSYPAGVFLIATENHTFKIIK